MVFFSKVQCSNEPAVAMNEGIDTCLDTIVSKFSPVCGNYFLLFSSFFFLFSPPPPPPFLLIGQHWVAEWDLSFFPFCVPASVMELLPEGCIKFSITQLSLLSLPDSEWFKHSTNVIFIDMILAMICLFVCFKLKFRIWGYGSFPILLVYQYSFVEWLLFLRVGLFFKGEFSKPLALETIQICARQKMQSSCGSRKSFHPWR